MNITEAIADAHQQANRLYQALALAGIPPGSFAIAGGAARNLAHGLPPKDLDLILLADVPALAANRVMILLGYDQDEVTTASGGDDSETNWSAVWQYSKPGCLDVDLLFAVPSRRDLQQVVDRLDYNINQYLLLPNGVVTFLGKNEGTLQALRDANICDERAAYIREKAVSLGWVV